MEVYNIPEIKGPGNAEMKRLLERREITYKNCTILM
jgi:hypothetical protein